MGLVGSKQAKDALIKVKASGRALYGGSEPYEVSGESATCVVQEAEEEVVYEEEEEPATY